MRAAATMWSIWHSADVTALLRRRVLLLHGIEVQRVGIAKEATAVDLRPMPFEKATFPFLVKVFHLRPSRFRIRVPTICLPINIVVHVVIPAANLWYDLLLKAHCLGTDANGCGPKLGLLVRIPTCSKTPCKHLMDWTICRRGAFTCQGSCDGGSLPGFGIHLIDICMVIKTHLYRVLGIVEVNGDNDACCCSRLHKLVCNSINNGECRVLCVNAGWISISPLLESSPISFLEKIPNCRKFDGLKLHR
mmetsp:Transcript_126546/g.369776  ORF Transcript_126546/g.369776 Transcript_126546/m.369776 type:complete len:248 (+) Transcript_126546:36-779(+)